VHLVVQAGHLRKIEEITISFAYSLSKNAAFHNNG
jgi:hypothetical protein